LHVLVLPMPLREQQINLSLIVDEANGPVLVDTGLPGQVEQVGAALTEAGVGLRDLKRIIITHQDIDHVGSLHDLVEATGARVLAHAAEVPYIDGSLKRDRNALPGAGGEAGKCRLFTGQVRPNYCYPSTAASQRLLIDCLVSS